MLTNCSLPTREENVEIKGFTSLVSLKASLSAKITIVGATNSLRLTRANKLELETNLTISFLRLISALTTGNLNYAERIPTILITWLLNST